MRSIDHVWLEELEVCDVGVVLFEFDLVADLFELRAHKGCVRVALAMYEGKDIASVVPTVLSAEPTGRFRKEDHAAKEDNGWYHLKAPWDAERFGAIEEGTTILYSGQYGVGLGKRGRLAHRDVEHDHDAPCDGPLLRSNETTSLRRRRQLGDVDWYLGGADSNAETIDDTAYDEHCNVLRCTNNGTTETPVTAISH